MIQALMILFIVLVFICNLKINYEQKNFFIYTNRFGGRMRQQNEDNFVWLKTCGQNPNFRW